MRGHAAAATAAVMYSAFTSAFSLAPSSHALHLAANPARGFLQSSALASTPLQSRRFRGFQLRPLKRRLNLNMQLPGPETIAFSLLAQESFSSAASDILSYPTTWSLLLLFVVLSLGQSFGALLLLSSSFYCAAHACKQHAEDCEPVFAQHVLKLTPAVFL